jgi:long-chain acyl-CoA synthetase
MTVQNIKPNGTLSDLIFKKLTSLAVNNTNKIIFYDRGNRVEKTFAELWRDVDASVGRLQECNPSTVGILGPTSYNWLVLDLACLLAGIQSVAFPESLSSSQLLVLLKQQPVDILFVDEEILGLVDGIFTRVERFGKLRQILPSASSRLSGNIKGNLIRSDYTIVFSSGTTGIPTAIPILRTKYEATFGTSFKALRYPGNTIIIFMPFSHAQQRAFAFRALMLDANVVISDQNNCLQHLVSERPNIMISVPAIYEAMADIIAPELLRFGLLRRLLLDSCNWLGINRMGSRRIIRKIYNMVVLGKYINTISGGRPDVFITASAPIKTSALKCLWRAGISVYDAYGQTELGMIAINTPESYRLGSVGKPVQEILISDAGEILVRYDVDRHSAIVRAREQDGFIRTGDLGYVDHNGFLYIKGRLNNVLVLKNGKKILPELVEDKFSNIDAVENAMVYDTDDGLTLVVILREGKNNGTIIQQIIDSSEVLADYEKPKQVVLLDSAGPDMRKCCTASGKIIRRVLEQYARDATQKIVLTHRKKPFSSLT